MGGGGGEGRLVGVSAVVVINFYMCLFSVRRLFVCLLMPAPATASSSSSVGCRAE